MLCDQEMGNGCGERGCQWLFPATLGCGGGWETEGILQWVTYSFLAGFSLWAVLCASVVEVAPLRDKGGLSEALRLLNNKGKMPRAVAVRDREERKVWGFPAWSNEACCG